MDEKKPEDFPEEVNPNTAPEPKTYPMTLECPNCGHNFIVETLVGQMFPEGKSYECPMCAFKEYAGYETCYKCQGHSHKHRLHEFLIRKAGDFDGTASELRGDRR